MGHLEVCGWHSNRAEAAKKEKSSCVESVLAAQGCGGKSPQGESFEIPSVRLLGGNDSGATSFLGSWENLLNCCGFWWSEGCVSLLTPPPPLLDLKSESRRISPRIP